MLNDREVHALMTATGAFLAGVCLDERSAASTLTEEHARKVGALHGFGDKAAGRLIFALACYLLEHKQDELLQRRDDMVALVTGKRGDEVIQ